MLYDRRHFISLATAAVVAGLAGGASASARQGEPAPVTIPLFRGQVGGSSNFQLGSWGSGRAETSKESVLDGDTSIKITTDGFYEGGRFDFDTPIDLSAAFQNSHTYVRFQIKFTGDNSSAQTFNDSTQEAGKTAASPFTKMRYLLVMADGTRYELIRPVTMPPKEDPDAYTPFAFPLIAITRQLAAGKTLSGDGAKLKQLAIFGDRYAQFLIGEIGIITDETEITVARLDFPTAFAKTDTQFTASAEGGASTLHYSWDFDADDGIQEDAEGRTPTHVFPVSGKGSRTYKITVTVSDVDGLKKPAVETFDLDVSD